MPANRPNPRPAAGVLLAIVAALIIPMAASGAVIYDETYSEIYAQDVTCTASGTSVTVSVTPSYGFYLTPALASPEYRQLLTQIPTSTISNNASMPLSDSTTVNLYVSTTGNTGAYYGTGTWGYFKFKSGSTWYCQIWLDIDPGANYELITGNEFIKFVPDDAEFIKPIPAANYQTTLVSRMDSISSDVSGYKSAFAMVYYHAGQSRYYFTSPTTQHYAAVWGNWKNRLVVDTTGEGIQNRSTVNLYRDFADVTSTTSDFYLTFGDTSYASIGSNDNVDYYVVADNYPFTTSVKSVTGQWYNETFWGDTPDTPIDPTNATATVYVQNSQTGALLADSHLSILAATGGTETEIINATLPGGTAAYTLKSTGGGIPNPDYYRAVATVPGFTQIVENHSFTLNGPHDVIIEMRPDSGGPLDPTLAYLEFYVRDLNANPIPAASIQCGGSIRQTNSAGYAVFEVLKNSTHPWIAKKSGYTTIEGTATVADDPRYVVNVVLGPGTVPTYTPTQGPGETPGGPGATPTPDHRTNEQKGQAVIDMIADNAEGIGALALICLLMGLLKLLAKW